MKTICLLALACLLLTACNIDVPSIQSCYLGSVSSSGGIADKKELSPTQLKALSLWFSKLGGDWTFKMSDHFPSGLVLVMNHTKNRTTIANLRDDQLWIKDCFRILTPSEREQLLTIVSEKNQLPIFGQH